MLQTDEASDEDWKNCGIRTNDVSDLPFVNIREIRDWPWWMCVSARSSVAQNLSPIVRILPSRGSDNIGPEFRARLLCRASGKMGPIRGLASAVEPFQTRLRLGSLIIRPCRNPLQRGEGGSFTGIRCGNWTNVVRQ